MSNSAVTVLAGLQPTGAVPMQRTGLLLPDSVVSSPIFAVIATFVAINTVIYVALAVAKILPRPNFGKWLHQQDRRTETRSIYPDGYLADTAAGPAQR